MSTTNTNDASFFALVHQLMAPKLDAARPQRGADRFTFLGVQKIAPCPNGELPPPSAFRDVECHDLSTGGFSCLSRQVPDVPLLAVHLASATISLWLKAEVCHTSELSDAAGPLYAVGCRFVGLFDSPA